MSTEGPSAQPPTATLPMRRAIPSWLEPPGRRVVPGGRAAVVPEGPEAPPPDDVARVAVLAHWSPDGRITRSVDALVGQLTGHGFHVVLVSSTPSPGPLRWPAGATPARTVLRRPNAGYDFGSWAVGLDRYPQVRRADRVLLVNDSMAGPFAALDHVLDDFLTTSADVWAVTDSTEIAPHLQSYLLGWTGGVLGTAPLRRFWSGVREQPTKITTVRRNEVRLGQVVRRAGLTTRVRHPGGSLAAPGANPVLAGWRALLDGGLPLVKRELLRSPDVAPDGHEVPADLLRRYGVSVADWV